MRECADVEGNHRMDARHLSYIFWVTTAPFSRAITKGAQLEKLAPMTGRKAGLLWKATVDEKESGWRGGWMAFSFLFRISCSRLFCAFWHLSLCIFFRRCLAGSLFLLRCFLLISGLRAELILGLRHVICMIALFELHEKPFLLRLLHVIAYMGH